MAIQNKPEKVVPSNHPLKGKEMLGCEAVLQVLADEGTDTIFGYSGGAILPTYDGVFRYNEQNPDKKMELIVPANEQGAGFMAAGYSRASGKVGVFLVTSGPGATNCVTPIRDCMSDSIPVVLICGQVARHAIGTDAFQEAPIFNIMSSAAKHVFLVTDEHKLEETMRSAFDIARSGRPGPVVVDIPKDVQIAKVKFKGEGIMHFRGYEERMSKLFDSKITPELANDFLELVKNSKRPLLYCGGGIINSNSHDQLRVFADHFKIPVVTTLMGIGAVDTMRDDSLHMLGMHGTAYANYAVADCDLFIAAGARFDDRVTGLIKDFVKDAKLAHFDVDPSEIGKVKQVDWQFVGNVDSALLDLVEAAKDYKPDTEKWLNYCAELKKNYPLNYKRDTEKIQPELVVEELNQITKGEAIIATGVGQHQMWAAQYMDFKHTPLISYFRQHGDDGLWFAGSDWCEVCLPGSYGY